ncbi:tRNA pseudouridine synthase B [Rhizodiscina lignyota]|uniref:tRNA pseudouridine(55) synthase n=1 Tax=Rhizodiscina lignyota TaxID=1504668 RepID=A0A9P4MBL6_9PEZI|nr:tRNA pseudouridine synthase B [Rhizodiscina lignyota]
MSQSSKIIEGVFAVHKPLGISSAQVLRDLQSAFNPSKTFAPWLAREKDRLNDEYNRPKNRKWSYKQKTRFRNLQVKLGHGGTLDPMATGVLIVGVGSGTKCLNQFLECTKTYETVVLFGAATDSYDAVGKIVARAPCEHITRSSVEEALAKFRGNIMQKPPIFSALKVQGKPMYEYARKGEELPIEIQERPVKVHELELLEWLDGGSHQYQFPTEEADSALKAAAQKVMAVEDKAIDDSTLKGPSNSADSSPGLRRKREDSTDHLITATSPSRKRQRTEPEALMSGALPPPKETEKNDEVAAPTSNDEVKTSETVEPLPPCPAPAVRLRMTVSSGFYVRSLAHDLGAAVGSLGLMAALVRSRQGDFELGKNVVEYEDIGKEEEVWSPQVEASLDRWAATTEAKDNGEARSEEPSNEGVAQAAVN